MNPVAPRSLYGTRFHDALRAAISHLTQRQAPATFSRAIADCGPVTAAELPQAAARVLVGVGLSVRDVDPAHLAQAIDPEQVILGLGRERHVVLAHESRRSVHVMSLPLQDADISQQILGRRQAAGWFARSKEEFTWLSISRRGGLALMANENGGMTPWRRLRALVRLERADITVVALFAATAGALTLITPIGSQALVNTIAFGTLLQPLIVLTAALFVGLALAGSIAALQAYVVEVLQRRILVRVAEDLGERLPLVAEKARDRKDLIELNNRFLDVVTVQKSVAELLLSGLSLVLQIAAGMLLLGFYHPMLLFFDILLVVALLAVMQLGRGGTRSALVESKAKFEIAAWLDEIARSPQRFAGGQGRQVAAEELASRAHAYVKARKAHFRRVFAVLLGGVALQVLSVVVLLGIGGWLVIARQLTLGQLVAAEIVISAIAIGIGKLGRLADKTFDLVAATDKLGKLLDLPLRTDGVDTLSDEPTGLSLCARELNAGYAGRTAAASGVRFDIPAGSRVLLDGPPGSGRSAILEALAGWRSPLSGRVLWDGHSSPRMEDTANRIALVRDGDLVSGSIFTNLRMADAGLSTAEAWAALAATGLDEVVDRLPGRLDCRLLPSGAPLSPSECRRLALARALIANPRLLLIDEILDACATDDAELDWLCERFLGADAPWTAVVVSRSSKVRSHLNQTVTLRGSRPATAAAAHKEAAS